jgi:glycerol uptake facilitator protein
VGTALLVVFGPGAVVAALTVGGGQLDYAGLGIISLSFGFVVALVIHAFGTTSGAHINPAVSVALASVGRFPWREVGPYVGAQLLGAVAGALVVVGVFGTERAVDVAGVGGTAVGEGFSYTQALVAEALATFLLLLTIMALAVDKRAPAGWAAYGIGLAVAVEIFVMAPVSGGSINPARTFGPYVATSLFGGSAPWDQYLIYVVGPVVGAVLACITYDLVARPRDAERAERAERVEVPQGTRGDITGRGE